MTCERVLIFFFFFQAEDGIRDVAVTGVQTCALPISPESRLAMDVAVAHRLHLPASSRKHRQRYLPHYLCAGGVGFCVPRLGLSPCIRSMALSACRRLVDRGQSQ